MKPTLNAIYIKPSTDNLGYQMTAFFIQGQVTKDFLDSLDMESLWNKARDLITPAYDTMYLEGYEIEYQSNIGRTAITLVRFNFITNRIKEKMDIIISNANRIRENFHG